MTSNIATVDPTDPAYRKWFLSALHKNFSPFEKQQQIARSLEDGFSTLVTFGRKGSKSSTATYCSVRRAGLRKEQNILLIAPKLKQAKEIYFDSRLLDKMIPKDALSDRYKSELRFVFHTGSFIRLDGADNPELHRGFDVNLLVGDEIKDFPIEFWPAMEFNLISVGGQMLLLGTPPDNDEEPSAKKFLELLDRFKTKPKHKYFTGSSYDNPFNDHEMIAQLERQHRALGQEDVVMREIYGVYAPGGRAPIFPMFDAKQLKLKHIFNDFQLENEWRDYLMRGELELWCLADPSSSVNKRSCFAMLFIGFHRKSGTIYCISELRALTEAETSTGAMWEKEQREIGWIHSRESAWRFIYDEAAKWFYNERVAQNRNPGWEPTQKNLWKADPEDAKQGSSLLKDIMLRNLLKIAETKCETLIGQIRSYSRDKNGNIPKRNDDLIDLLRYFLMQSGYELPTNERPLIIPASAIEDRFVDPVETTQHTFEHYLYEEYETWEF